MVDRYTQTVLTVIALCLVVLTVSSLLPAAQARSAPQPQPAVHAQAATQVPSAAAKKRCVWSWIRETDLENTLGKDGEIRLGRTYTAMSEGGFELKATAGVAFVFERCDEK